MHFAATGAMLGHCLLYFTPATFHHLCTADWDTQTLPRVLQTTIAGSLVLLGLPHLHVPIVGANTQAFSRSGIGRMSRATDWSAKRFHPSAMAFPGGAGNFALIPRAPARPLLGRTRLPTDPAGTRLRLGLLSYGKLRNSARFLGRVRDTLCMSVVLSINASETGLAPERFQAFAGLFFQDAEMGCASFLSA